MVERVFQNPALADASSLEPTIVRILVTNDDGFTSPGLWALAESLMNIGEVVVVAPDREQSGVGCSVTLHHPLRITNTRPFLDGVEAYAVQGTPADSVILATETLIKGPIDLLVSGINSGANLGNDVFVSGTVGAAFHGYFRQIPSVAISVTALVDVRFDVAAKLALALASLAQAGSLPKGLLLNVNLPNKASDQLKGILVTRLSGNTYADVVDEGTDARQKYYWIKRSRPAWKLDEGTDVWAVQRDYVSITPLGNDVTAHPQISRLEDLELPL